MLAEDLFRQFDEVELMQPFEQSLLEKQKRMDDALAALESLVDYEVGEVTAAATFYIAEIYMGFSESLVTSERPTDLGPAELQDYELMIEEEAFPFEERSIEVHEKNLELKIRCIEYLDERITQTILAGIEDARYEARVAVLEAELRELLVRETGTLGVRARELRRWPQRRTMTTVDVDGHCIGVKISADRVKVEFDDAA